MDRRKLSPLRILALFAIVSILAAWLLPRSSHHGHRALRCASNLQQLYKLGTLYASQHQGQWPDSGDENLWVAFTKMKPPLIEPDHVAILGCPVHGEEVRPGETDYMAPRIPWSKLASTDPVAADRPGNHGDGEGRYVLLKNGDVLECSPGDALWRRCEEVLR